MKISIDEKRQNAYPSMESQVTRKLLAGELISPAVLEYHSRVPRECKMSSSLKFSHAELKSLH